MGPLNIYTKIKNVLKPEFNIGMWENTLFQFLSILIKTGSFEADLSRLVFLQGPFLAAVHTCGQQVDTFSTLRDTRSARPVLALPLTDLLVNCSLNAAQYKQWQPVVAP